MKKLDFNDVLEFLDGAEHYLVNGTLVDISVLNHDSVYAAPRIIIFGPVHVSLEEKDIKNIQVNPGRSGINLVYGTQTLSIIPLRGKTYEDHVSKSPRLS